MTVLRKWKFKTKKENLKKGKKFKNKYGYLKLKWEIKTNKGNLKLQKENLN